MLARITGNRLWRFQTIFLSSHDEVLHIWSTHRLLDDWKLEGDIFLYIKGTTFRELDSSNV